MVQTLIQLITSQPGRTWNKQCHPKVQGMFKTLLGLVCNQDMVDKMLGEGKDLDKEREREMRRRRKNI
jgi:hypothetical protein